MKAGAKICTECDTYAEGWRRHFKVISTVLALLIALFTMLSFLIPAVFDFVERHSNTKFKVTGADDKYVYLNVWNTGRKPSMLVGYRLRFNELPIRDATLDLSAENKRDAKGVIRPNEPVRIALTIPELAMKRNSTKGGILALAKVPEQSVTLVLDIEESDDPWLIVLRPYHKRFHTVPADRIKAFIQGRIPDVP